MGIKVFYLHVYVIIFVVVFTETCVQNTKLSFFERAASIQKCVQNTKLSFFERAASIQNYCSISLISDLQSMIQDPYSLIIAVEIRYTRDKCWYSWNFLSSFLTLLMVKICADLF